MTFRNITWITLIAAETVLLFGPLSLPVLTPWRVMPNRADKGETRSLVTFLRGKD